MSSFIPVNLEWRRAAAAPCKLPTLDSEELSRSDGEIITCAVDDEKFSTSTSCLVTDDVHMEISPTGKPAVESWDHLIDIARMYGFSGPDRARAGPVCKASKRNRLPRKQHHRLEKSFAKPAPFSSSGGQQNIEHDRANGTNTAPIAPSHRAPEYTPAAAISPIGIDADEHQPSQSTALALPSKREDKGLGHNILFVNHSPAYGFVEHQGPTVNSMKLKHIHTAIKTLPSPPPSSDGESADTQRNLSPPEPAYHNSTPTRQPAPIATHQLIDATGPSSDRPLKARFREIPYCPRRTIYTPRPLLTIKFRPLSPDISRTYPRTDLPPLLPPELPFELSADRCTRNSPPDPPEQSSDRQQREPSEDEAATQESAVGRKQQGHEEEDQDRYEVDWKIAASSASVTRLTVLRAARRLAKIHPAVDGGREWE